jgi:hypothetical protein
MSMELEGNILLERAPMRRWVSIIAVVIPAAAFGMLATWFIRAYIAPPTVAVPSPMMLASAPQEPAPPQQIETKLPGPATPTAVVSAAQVSITAPSVAEPVAPPGLLPMLNTLPTIAPTHELPPAERAQEPPPPATVGVAQAAAFDKAAPEASEPSTGRIPMPRSKPRLSLARVTGPVPLPRPKPAEELPPPNLPANDIHAVQ